MDGDEIVDTDGNRHKVEVVVYATGLKSTDFLFPLTVKGLDGVDLHATWNGEPEAYLGVSVPDFPNLFLMYGPNTNTHNSIIGMLEAQAKYIARKALAIQSDVGRYITVKRPALESFYSSVTPEFDKFSWSGGCHNWYRTASGKVVNNWPARTRVYFELLARDDDANYEIASVASSRSQPVE
ncbi:4-hydroxyacetophenone monooxygenase [compost metagenome]